MRGLGDVSEVAVDEISGCFDFADGHPHHCMARRQHTGRAGTFSIAGKGDVLAAIATRSISRRSSAVSHC